MSVEKHTSPPARGSGCRLLAQGYVPILRTVFAAGHRGTTWMTVSRKHFARRERPARQAIQDMSTVGLVHIDRWETRVVGKRAMPVAMYVFGKGENAPHPGFANGAQQPKVKRRVPIVSLITLALAIEILQEDEYHGNGLAAAIGITSSHARKIIKALHEGRFIHISDYDRRPNGGTTAPLYRFGINKPDAPRPAPTPERELWDRYNRDKAARLSALKALGKAGPSRAKSLGFTYSMAAEAA